jgi:spermidine synthase
MSTEGYFTEKVAPGVRVAFEAERLRYQVKSSAHEKVVIDNAHFGRMMMIDGVVQLSSADAFIYHEMMSHVPLLAHGHVERVLIIGGGDCGLAMEVLRHPGVRKVVQVEIDPQVVKLAQTYFADLNGPVFRDRRFRLHIRDGAEFVATTDERFDLILVDSTDPGGVSLPLFTENFYRDARGCLRPGGLLIAQLGVPFLQAQAFQAAMTRLASVFPLVSCYLVPVPCIFGGPLAFGWASSTLSSDGPGVDVLAARYATSRIAARYYTPELHRASFALPRCIGDVVERATRPHEEREEDMAGCARTRARQPRAQFFSTG